MELKQFIQTALVDIVEGVEEAKKLGGKERIQPPSEHRMKERIEFDIAVTVNEGTTTKGGIGVWAGAVGLGTQGQSNQSNQSVSRIKFSVLVDFL